MRNPAETTKTNQKTFLMIGGAIVIVAIVWWYMKKRREDQGTGAQLPKEGEFIPAEPTLTEDEISRKYAMDTFGITSEVADQVVEKANWINNNPEGNWYIHSVKRAKEEGRDVPTQLLHEAFWVINQPNRMREYAETTWGRNYDEAEEIRVYAMETVKPNEKWHADATVKAKERGRDVWQQLLHEANWQLYVKEGAKYK